MSAVAVKWDVDGADWPNRAHSAFVRSGDHLWHVQRLGNGPALLLIHGTGASTHSWRDLAPLLAEEFEVLAFDLPGHGFSEMPEGGQYDLPRMANAISALLTKLRFAPELVVAHSAGAAIAVCMAADGAMAPRAIVSLNGALLPFPGWGAVAFPALARLLFLNPFAPRFFAQRASDPEAVARLISGTGSKLDARGLDLYTRLFRSTRHIAATVGMMAKWDLLGFQRALRGLRIPLFLIACEKDRAVAPHLAEDVRARVPGASVVKVKGLGHLAHEEAPEQFAALIAELVPC